MARLKNHSEAYWLEDEAAAAFNRMEDDHGFIDLNSAGRHEWEQQELINRWDRGGAANRPPYLYAPARPASASNHVRGGGRAFDTSEYRRVREFCEDYGFRWFGNSDVVHFDYVGGGSGGSGNTTVKNEQNFLISRGYDLGPTGADGIAGPYYTSAVKAYQTYLAGRGWYSGTIDGIWGAGTQSGHEKFYAELNPPAPAPAAGNPFGIGSCAGLQKIAKLYGYTGAIDQIWGAGSAAGFARFLRQNWGYVGNDVLGPVMWRAIARWLRARWGYVGNDVPGPVMRAALQRAETANYNEL